MFCQQNQQKYQLPTKSLSKYPPKRFPQVPQFPQFPQAPQAPQAPAPCLPPARTHYVSSCSISGFGGCSSLVSRRFPSNTRRQPQPSSCVDVELAGCSSCCHGFGDYS
ncbi:late cornified envelope protein 7A [Capricornis sumatraensis]|uniref:late cornified envelope protein 7A n=1 Tax=Capricornis sumatraensis TaxID=34865 RepID=UPI0036049905